MSRAEDQARILMLTPKVGAAIYMTAKGDRARLDIELATDCVIALIQQH
jgi:hypothetical protein